MIGKSIFTGKADIYSKSRPGYSAEFFEYLKNSVPDISYLTAADIGSGTGKFTDQLLRIGMKVFGVEPNDDMRKKAENNLSQYKGFVSVKGDDKNFNLEPSSVDFVTAAQAFHWFDPEAFKNECLRVLKKGGKVILVWNFRDKNDERIIKNAEICKKFCPDFTGFSGGERFDLNKIPSFFDGKCEILEFENNLFYSRDKFVERILSASYSLTETDKLFGEYVSELENFFDDYSQNNILEVPNKTVAYIGNI